MKLMSLSLDPLILDATSVVAVRNARYGEVLERYTVVAPSKERKVVPLGNNSTAYGTGGANKLSQFIRMCGLMYTLLRRERYDVITSQDTYFLALIGLIFSRLFHLGLEVQVLGIEKLSPWRKMLSRFTLTRADSIRVLSIGLKRRLIQEFGIQDERMMLVPIYVDVSSLGYGDAVDEKKQAEIEKEVASFKERYGDRINLVSVNRLVAIKNIPMQIEAVARIREKFPSVLLHIVGDGPLRGELEVMIKERGIASHVILHGPQFGSKLRPFFSESDCFLLTSDFEGYGMVVIEAATAGACIVMTEVGCAGEVIVDGVSGRIVPPRDIDAFTKALEDVLGDSALRAELKAGAKRSIAELPTFDKVLEKYMASWTQALINSKKK